MVRMGFFFVSSWVLEGKLLLSAIDYEVHLSLSTSSLCSYNKCRQWVTYKEKRFLSKTSRGYEVQGY